MGVVRSQHSSVTVIPSSGAHETHLGAITDVGREAECHVDRAAWRVGGGLSESCLPPASLHGPLYVCTRLCVSVTKNMRKNNSEPRRTCLKYKSLSLKTRGHGSPCSRFLLLCRKRDRRARCGSRAETGRLAGLSGAAGAPLPRKPRPGGRPLPQMLTSPSLSPMRARLRPRPLPAPDPGWPRKLSGVAPGWYSDGRPPRKTRRCGRKTNLKK